MITLGDRRFEFDYLLGSVSEEVIEGPNQMEFEDVIMHSSRKCLLSLDLVVEEKGGTILCRA